MESFVAIDVETANADLASICQIGLVSFEDGRVAESWESLVDPEDYFDPYNIEIHGITEQAVLGSPTISVLRPELEKRLASKVVVSHTPFDRLALSRALEQGSGAPLVCSWLDSARVVRRTWLEFSSSGYGLANIAEFLAIPFKHHVAVEDARAAGEIVVRAIAHSGIGLYEWLTKAHESLGGRSVEREGRPDGALFGEVVVFTGALEIPRREAADLAAAIGCAVAENVTKQTTLLVVGDQDVRALAGHQKSSKHRKAEELVKKGREIRIIGERDFQRLVRTHRHD